MATYLSRPDSAENWVGNLPVPARLSRKLGCQRICPGQTQQKPGLPTYLSRPDPTEAWVANLPVPARPNRSLGCQLTCPRQTQQKPGLPTYLSRPDSTEAWVANVSVPARLNRSLGCQLTCAGQTKQKTGFSGWHPVCHHSEDGCVDKSLEQIHGIIFFFLDPSGYVGYMFVLYGKYCKLAQACVRMYVRVSVSVCAACVSVFVCVRP